MTKHTWVLPFSLCATIFLSAPSPAFATDTLTLPSGQNCSSAGGTPSEKHACIFGDPDILNQQFTDSITPGLNGFMGLGVAIAGFVLVLRALFS